MFSRQRLSSGLMVFIFLTVSAYPQLITGSASMKLSGPVTRDVTDQGRKSANVKLKTELLLWLQDNSGLALDTTNALDNYHFDLFVTACIKKGKEESSFKGSNWTITYSIPAQNVGEALTDFNGENDSLAVVFWNRCKTSMENKNYASAYVEGVKALGYACAHFGPPSQTPGMTGHDLIDDVRNTAQDLFNRIQVKSSDMVIKGKAGLVPENPPIITLTADSTPLAGITFTASLPSGRELFTTISGDNGEVSLDNMKIPFVANGTFLYITMDLGRTMGVSRFIEAKDFGLTLNNGQDQTFIYKLTKPTFTLDYKASAVSKVQLPPDFTTDALIRKFLRDSCFMEPASATIPPDLAISLNSQVSSYSFDDAEESAVKVTSMIVIKGNSLNPPRSEQQEMIYEKRYDKTASLPLGLFFWETNNKLRSSLKTILERM